MKGLFSALLALVGCGVAVRSVAAQQTSAGPGALVRQLVVESLQGGGSRADMVLVAADSASAILLRMADLHPVVTPDPKGLVCPASTEADGRPVGSPVGYGSRRRLPPEPTARSGS